MILSQLRPRRNIVSQNDSLIALELFVMHFYFTYIQVRIRNMSGDSPHSLELFRGKFSSPRVNRKHSDSHTKYTLTFYTLSWHECEWNSFWYSYWEESERKNWLKSSISTKSENYKIWNLNRCFDIYSQYKVPFKIIQSLLHFEPKFPLERFHPWFLHIIWVNMLTFWPEMYNFKFRKIVWKSRWTFLIFCFLSFLLTGPFFCEDYCCVRETCDVMELKLMCSIPTRWLPDVSTFSSLTTKYMMFVFLGTFHSNFTISYIPQHILREHSEWIIKQFHIPHSHRMMWIWTSLLWEVRMYSGDKRKAYEKNWYNFLKQNQIMLVSYSRNFTLKFCTENRINFKRCSYRIKATAATIHDHATMNCRKNTRRYWVDFLLFSLSFDSSHSHRFLEPFIIIFQNGKCFCMIDYEGRNFLIVS